LQIGNRQSKIGNIPMRSKPFLTYFLLSAVPLLLLAALNYWNATRSVAATLNRVVQNDLNAFIVNVDEVLSDRESVLLKLAVSPEVQRLKDDASLRDRVEASLKSLALNEDFQSVTLFDHNRQPAWAVPAASQPDDRVWTLQGNVFVDRVIDDASGKKLLQYSVPIHDQKGLGNEGALVATIDLELLFSAASQTGRTQTTPTDARPMVLVRDSQNKAIFLSAPPAPNGVLPMREFAAEAPLPRLGLDVIVSRNESPFISNARRWGLAGFVLALLFAVLAAFLLNRHVRQRSRGMARVTEDLSAIAHGDLDRRILLQSSDDARGIADNINAMTAQLRAQIAREEESRQFDSFVRLSAMLTHDLKNAIEGLSLTVNNMERHFDNEQFRIDAMKGLAIATDKLREIVARLSRPVSSLSGEHKRPTKTDLVPILKRVIALTAEPMRGKHTIQTKLPDSLFALVDGPRIEEVAENLILNAIEAMTESGTLIIEAGPAANGEPSFAVSDTGPGMSPTFIEQRLFRPFSTTKKNGIGLGLYTCREVIRASGGRIDVESVQGAGTTFRVVLPSIPPDRRNQEGSGKPS
jgi:signal transduction histidine kinase